MPQQVGIISAQTVNANQAMGHQRPPLAQSLDNQNSVISPLCCAVVTASAGLFAACMGARHMVNCGEIHDMLFGASAVMVGITDITASAFYAKMASINLNYLRGNRVAEIQASIELPEVPAAENRV
ncbi:MAG: hypothetical protein ACK5Q1_12930 [Limnobacter sp.]